LGNYTLIDDFYVVDLANTHVVLGVQWLYSLGDIRMSYQDMRMEFQDKGGQRVILRGMSTSAPGIVCNQRMEALFKHRDMACAAKCLITMEKPSHDRQQYLADIQALLGKHERVFEPLLAGRPPDKGFEHVIELEEGLKLMITTPYRHLLRFGYLGKWSPCVCESLNTKGETITLIPLLYVLISL
jgi:hypothetical protein